MAEVRVARRRGVVFAGVTGGIDTETCEQVRDELVACLADRPSALVVDLDEVGFFGSLGIAVLVEVRERAARAGVAFAVAAGRRTVTRPMHVTQVDDLLGLCPTVDEAVALVEGGRRPDEPEPGFSWWSS